jgi:hypothetical protein
MWTRFKIWHLKYRISTELRILALNRVRHANQYNADNWEIKCIVFFQTEYEAVLSDNSSTSIAILKHLQDIHDYMYETFHSRLVISDSEFKSKLHVCRVFFGHRSTL